MKYKKRLLNKPDTMDSNMEFIEKSSVVEAICWDGWNEEDIYDLVGNNLKIIPINDPEERFLSKGVHIRLRTKYGIIEPYIGDYIIKEEDGSIDVLSSDNFKKIYEKIV